MPKSERIPTIRVKPRDYNPPMAELEETIILRDPDGSRATPEQVAHAVTRTVRVVEDPDA